MRLHLAPKSLRRVIKELVLSIVTREYAEIFEAAIEPIGGHAIDCGWAAVLQLHCDHESVPSHLEVEQAGREQPL